MIRDFYYWQAGAESGPISLDELKDAMREGRIGPRARVKRGERGVWHAAGDLPWSLMISSGGIPSAADRGGQSSPRRLLLAAGTICLFGIVFSAGTALLAAAKHFTNGDAGFAVLQLVGAMISAVLLLAAAEGIRLLLDLESRLMKVESAVERVAAQSKAGAGGD